MARMIWSAEKFEKEVRFKADKIVKDNANDVAKDIRASWSSSSPSSPGNPPAVVTGELDRSIGVERVGVGVFKVGPSLEISLKALSLEYGTRNMAPRPYLRPAIKRGGEKMKKDLQKGLNR
jgi:HK97 gp10 family phage protein